jgi:hypothetical protein
MKTSLRKSNKMCLLRDDSALSSSRKLFPRRNRNATLSAIRSQETCSPTYSYRPSTSRTKRKGTSKRTSTRSAPLVWTKMECVIYWLYKEGVTVACQKRPNDKPFYILDGHICSPCQALLFANRRRLLKGDPLFFVETLTEY